MRQLPIGTVTLLFTDIEGSTRLLQQLNGQYVQVLGECRRLLRDAFQQWHGFEVDTQGDAFFVVFERATDALLAAVAVQRALYEAHWPERVSVRVRIGLHTGEPQAAEEGYIGLDVHRAARIMGVAHGGQVLLSQATRDLITLELPEDIQVCSLGEHRLKDIEGKSQLFQLVVQDLPSVFPPLSTVDSPRTLSNIPLSSSTFVGREQDIATLIRQVQRPEVRLFTLIGVGGVGKTRLILQLATLLRDQLASAVCFVALEHVRDESEVMPAIAQALDIQEEKRALLSERVKAVLCEQSVFLMLDNFEQVLSAGPLLAELLASCPGLKILVTSRVMLHLRGEHLFEVQPLPLPSAEQKADLPVLLRVDAIDLFVQRAQALQPGFRLTDANAADIIEICRYLDGIPLAIELAAAHTRHFPPASLLVRLKQGTGFLQGKVRDVPARQQTLRNAIEWSYNLLTPDEQAVFRRIALCRGGVTLEAAEQICAGAGSVSGDIGQILADLVDQSMVRRQEDAGDSGRFDLLQTLREYGVERLSEAGELRATQEALSEYMLSWSERVTPMLTGAEQVFWLDQLERERENVRIVLVWMLEEGKQIEQALRLCVALAPFWEGRCYFEEGLTFLERALAGSQGVESAVRAQALYCAGFLALMIDEVARAEAFLRESQLLFREGGDRATMAAILRLQGSLAVAKEHYKIARRLFEEALNIDLSDGNVNRAIATRFALSQIALEQGDYRHALHLLAENQESYQAIHEYGRMAYALYFKALIYFLSHQEQGAVHKLIGESLALFRSIGDRRFAASALSLRGQLLGMEEDYEGAMAVLEESKKTFREVGERFGTARVLIWQARVMSEKGEWERAQTLYRESWQIAQTIEARGLLATCLERYGEDLFEHGTVTQAVQYWGLAATTRAAIVAPMPPVYRTRHIEIVARARQLLSEEEFLVAWKEGGKRSLLELSHL